MIYPIYIYIHDIIPEIASADIVDINIDFICVVFFLHEYAHIYCTLRMSFYLYINIYIYI